MSSIFGNAGTQNQPQSTGLFGSGATQNQPPGTGLFGSGTAQPQQQQSTSLFGNNPAQNQQSGGTGLFGAAQNQNQNQPAQGGGSLFGAAPNQSQPQPASAWNTASGQTSLFNNPPPAAPNPASSLFTQPASQRSTAERTFTNPQQTHLSALLQSGLGANPNAFGSLGLSSQNDLAKSRLASVGINANPNEKTVVAQIQTLVRKWDPKSADTLMQTHLYNAVNAAYAPFYYRNADEDEAEWEEALKKKPKPVEVGGENISFVPVLVRGFYDLGQRVEYQARIVNDMRARLHEMNNSLDAVMARHQQNISVRLENAKRQHAALSQRCLRLAVKTQVLRHRGYPLDPAEEGLRKSLQQLEKTVMDPSFAAREEEIWARMVALRERSRWLEEETKRLGGQIEEQQQKSGSGSGQGVSDEVLLRTKKILSDYDGQLKHLAGELAEVKTEFEEWENSRRR
jgi:nuclear pore complex protein Nup54